MNSKKSPRQSEKKSPNNILDNLSLSQRSALFFTGIGALATGAAGSGLEYADKIAVVSWLSAAVSFWHLIGKDRRNSIFKKCEENALRIKSLLDGDTITRPSVLNEKGSVLKSGLPPFSLLPQPPAWVRQVSEERTGTGYAMRVNRAFRRCGLLKEGSEKIEVISVQSGPAAARITVSLPDGLRLTRLQHMTNDLASAFGVESLQVISGIQAGAASLIISHKNRLPVVLRTVLESVEFKDSCGRAELPMVIGVNDIGEPIIIDLVRVRHLLVAGTTGSGKSWFINEVLVTLLATRSPDILNFVLIDPKKVELSQYQGLPHTIMVATEIKQAVAALEYLVKEMERRYTVFEKAGVKNVQQYWKKTGDRSIKYIIGVIDELADLMAVAKKDVEVLLQRLTQLARAAGIHMIVATQRPSVDVITGVIKSNLPSRVVFQLVSGPDYRTVLNIDQDLKLRGRGDGVALLEGYVGLVRFQSPGIGIDDDEADEAVSKIKTFWSAKEKTGELPTQMLINTESNIQKTSGEKSEYVPSDHVLKAVPGPGMVELPDFPDFPGADNQEEYSVQVIEDEPEDVVRFKTIIAQAWIEAVEADLEQKTAPPIRLLREKMNIKQERVMELIEKLVSEGWLIPPPIPKKPYLIMADEEYIKKYLRH